MSHDPAAPGSAPGAPFRLDQWSDASSRDALRLIAESVAQMVGFRIAAISAVHGDEIVTVAVAGGEDVVAALADMRTPLDNIANELAVAEDWGRFKFVDHEVTDPDDEFRWIPDIEPSEEPDGWHPMDALLAPLYDESGELSGLLSIDVPVNGRRPDATQRYLLERYAAQAERTLRNALDREALAHRLRLAEAASEVVSFAVSQSDLDAVIDECRPALMKGFRADDLTLRTYADAITPAGGTTPRPVPEELRALVRETSRKAWAAQTVAVLHRDLHDHDLVSSPFFEQMMAELARHSWASVMVVPIGAGTRCLGHILFFRNDDGATWTSDERVGALEIARDFGQSVVASRNLAREQRLVSELRELDTYKTQLLSTVSHELKNPLGAISGHLELAAETPRLAPDVQFSISSMERAAARITRLVDNLLTLSRLEDLDDRAPATAIDLRGAVAEGFEASRFAAESRELTLRLHAPAEPLIVHGEPDGLERIFVNLVSNAVKYSRRGGSVTVQVIEHDDEIEIAVDDDGIGISADDQARLFTEFFRSTNPAALAEPGTGLGLTITARIVERHGGRITVDSTLGAGSTFRVFLPALEHLEHSRP